jgi:hypothetical protein
VLGLAAAGAVLLIRRDPVAGALVLAPIGAAYLAALLRLYPIADRLTLWFVPLLLVLSCVPVDALVAAIARRRTSARVLVPATAGLLAVAIALAVSFAVPYARGTRGMPLSLYARTARALRFVAEHAGPDDRVLISRYTVPAALWYGDREHLRWDGRFELAFGTPICGGEPIRDSLPGAKEVWLVLGPLANDDWRLGLIRSAMRPYTEADGTWQFGGLIVERYRPRPANARAGNSVPEAGGLGACLLPGPKRLD